LESSAFSPEQGTEVFTTRTAQMWVGAGEIARMVCLPNCVHNAEDAQQNIHAIVDAKPRPIIVDIRRLKSVSRAAREVYRDHKQNPDLVAVAMVVDSPLSRIIGNFFLGVSRVYVPTRLFTDEQVALRWLEPFVRQEGCE
jgi:hypothetical protein